MTCRKRPALRAGYTGHITQIATKLAEAGETRSLIAECLDKHQEWRKFAAEKLHHAHQVQAFFKLKVKHGAVL